MLHKRACMIKLTVTPGIDSGKAQNIQMRTTIQRRDFDALIGAHKVCRMWSINKRSARQDNHNQCPSS